MKNRYGNFGTDGMYVLDHPDTPTKWENKLFNDEYVLNITQRLEGDSYIAEDYVQTKIMDFSRRFYLSISGNAHRLFCGEKGSYRAEYHPDKIIVTEETQEYKATAEVTVPAKGRRELWQISVENKAEEADFNIFCFFPFVNSGPMGGECTISADNRCVYKFSFPYHVFYEDVERVRRKHGYTFVAADREITSFDGDGQAFWGSDNLNALPYAVKANRCSNVTGQGDRLDAALHFQKRIENSGTFSVTLAAGSADTFEEIQQLIHNFPQFDSAYEKAQKYREQHYKGYSIETPYEELNYMFNKWLPKQLVYLTRLNRGGVYCPVRNRLQDALGYSILDPEGALEIALSVLRRQHFSGYLKQWYMTDGSPEKDLCKINHSDACVWLVLCIVEIINNCGDISIFQREEPYMDSDIKESVLNHLKKAVHYMYSKLGTHGLCLMLDGDWTDPINGAGRGGRGESVWNSMALIYAINNLTELFPDEELSAIADTLKNAINEYCWDGEWYIAGFDDNGKPFGTKRDEEGRLFLNTQTWALISGIVPEERKSVLKQSIDRLKVPFGWLLLDKPFTKWNDTWGRISVKQKGTTENGSVYCHATMFKALSDCIEGDKDGALNAVMRTLPINPDNPPEKNLQLPLFVPNYYFGIENENFGKSSCNYSTGTTAWLIWVMIKHILGIKTTVNGVTQENNTPKLLKGSVVKRIVGNKEYHFIAE